MNVEALMPWSLEDGEHEGWGAAVLPDGRVADGSALGVVLVGLDRVPEEQVIGFQCRCTCGWTGAYWTHVPAPGQADPAQRLLYTEHGGDVPEDVEREMHREWKVHVAPVEALAAVRSAAEAHAETGARVTETVVQARRSGSSWTDIGRAVGISRQSAHERWAALAP